MLWRLLNGTYRRRITEEEFFEETTTMVIEVLKEEFEMEETNILRRT